MAATMISGSLLACSGSTNTVRAAMRSARRSPVGAGAVVTKTVPDYALVIGNPSRQVGWMSEFGHKLNFNHEGLAECSESKEMYKFENNTVTKLS